MYSKAVYDYFNSNPEKVKQKPNKLTRANAIKKKAMKKTVIVPKKSNTSSISIKSSTLPPIENYCQKTLQTKENRSTVNVVYDTVQSIWKYAKSFISNQNSESNRSHERLRNRIKNRTSDFGHSKYLRKKIDQKEVVENCEPFEDTTENLPQATQGIIEEEFKKKAANLVTIRNTTTEINFKNNEQQLVCQEWDLKKGNQRNIVDIEDLLTIEGLVETTLPKIPEIEMQSLEEINFENLENPLTCSELELHIFDSNNDNVTPLNYEQTVETDKPVEETTSGKNMRHKNKLTEVFIKQDLQKTDSISELILKSSMKTYGRGRRKNKKLHVHFKDVYDNEKSKYSTYTSKRLRQSDCCHPNAFYKKINQHVSERKKSIHNIREKRRRLALCTGSNRSSFRKERSKLCSFINTSIQSKSSNTCTNKTCKKTNKISKKYSVNATTKICKRKCAACRKANANNAEKAIKTLQQIIQTVADNKLQESVHISDNDTREVMKAINIGDELRNSNISSTTEDELNEFAKFLNDEQPLDLNSFE